MNDSTWKLDPADVTWGSSVLWKEDDPFDITLIPDGKHSKKPMAGAGRSRHLKPRNAEQTDLRLRMEHVPTGIEVNGRALSYYTRKEKSNLDRVLREELFAILEKKVAEHLRIPGR